MNAARTHKLYRSPTLERLWPYGYSSIGDVSFESAAYVARYVVKKVKVSRDDDDRLVVPSTGEVLAPEYVTMSRGSGLDDPDPRFRGGIGRSWYDKFRSDVYPLGNRVVRGKDMRPPKFYDKLYAVDDPFGFEELSFRRMNSLDKSDNTEVRLLVKEKVTVARVNSNPRS